MMAFVTVTSVRSISEGSGGQWWFGVIALASEDPKRFYPEMGTLYLRRLAEVATAAIERNRQETAQASAA